MRGLWQEQAPLQRTDRAIPADSRSVFEERRFDPELAARHLKVCVLCGALLTRRESTCYSCGWTGPFSTAELELREALIRTFGRGDSAAIDALPTDRP
jgi:hypothetical protein